jgi:hypothetical protein
MAVLFIENWRERSDSQLILLSLFNIDGSTTNLVSKYFYSGFELIVKITLVEMMNKKSMNLISPFWERTQQHKVTRFVKYGLSSSTEVKIKKI